MKSDQNLKAASRQQNIFWEARTRILAWYLALITSFLALSVPVITHLILFQVNLRVRHDLIEELEVFDNFQQAQFPQIETTNEAILAQLFEEFLNYKIPEDDTFLITILDGQFYRSNPRLRPHILAVESSLMQKWLTFKQPTQGEWTTSNPEIGRILYLTKPVIVRGEVTGILVAAHLTAGEVKEAFDAVRMSLGILVIVLLCAALAAWIASEKVLNPLQKLSKTVSSIDESDLEQRIAVTGSGEIAQLTKRFNQMMERLQKVFLSQRELLNDAGHELRTPITIIRGHLELMGNDPQEQEETLAIVFDELDRMSRLVNNLVLLAKAERFDFLQEETIDIALFTQEIYSKITTLALRNWQLNNRGRGHFQGDRQRLTQAIINLAQNAVQHTEETDRIILGSKSDRDRVSFSIQDTGEGFAAKDRELIFQRFARAANNRRHSQGQGLGLSIVQAIAKAHGGKVEANGEIGKGATFTLILPLNRFQ
ncbi:MAG TPA: HAMP domain-containing sensor histidine kinase [Coleofasciculaceae cyanobacterium]